jgi:hypothetical protein
MAKDMFQKSTIVLGSETDEKIFSALNFVLATYGIKVKEKKYYVVGSQEITEYEALIGTSKLKIVSETYEGLSIKGITKLINEVKVQNFTSADGCPVSSGLVFARIQTSDSGSGSRAYALAIAAKMAGKKVKLVVDSALKKPRVFVTLKH